MWEVREVWGHFVFSLLTRARKDYFCYAYKKNLRNLNYRNNKANRLMPKMPKKWAKATFSAFSFVFSYFLRTFAADYGVNAPWSTAAAASATRQTLLKKWSVVLRSCDLKPEKFQMINKTEITTVHAFRVDWLCLYLFIIGFLRTASQGCGAFQFHASACLYIMLARGTARANWESKENNSHIINLLKFPTLWCGN